LVIGGDARTGITFQHADGTPYGGPLRPKAVELAEQAFDALCKLGFPQTRARALLEQALAEAQPPCSLAALLERTLLLA
jgi:Holliday junction resolvasome RuvABC DNA-binding subunit